jgi:hypothetical protein
MKKLWVFGDSFVAPNHESHEWARLLADKLNIEYENFGVGASSSEHAMRQFQKIISSTQITNSVIIVLLSTVGRLDLEFQIERPETAAIYAHSYLVTNDPHHEWYRENRKYLEWLTVNYNYKSAWLNRECYIHTLKNYAESEPSNLIIVLQNSLQSSRPDSIIPRGNPPENFIMPEIDFNKISTNEMIVQVTWQEHIKHTGKDARVNHLTIPNLEIMAQAMSEVILTRDVFRLSYDRFQRSIINQIKTQQQLDEYIAAGILYPNIVKEVK